MELILSLHHVDAGASTQVVKLGGYFYLNHFTGPEIGSYEPAS